ncbi:MAG: glycerophosphodiester phosphodiesterase, partial [Ruminococcaceae bacterium]|nr:glycerophosphodiester phosphodiesterase [Oscillospiraceae bacterium]
MTTKIWAHRGASLKAPENSLPAFALAVELGADGIELDVQLSKDGVPVVFHDFELARLTGVNAWLRDLTLPELKKLNLNQQERFPELGFVEIPTLAEVFELLLQTKLKINIEIKSGQVVYPLIEEKVLALAADYDLNERVWYSSFNHYSLVQLRQFQPEAHCGILFDNVLFQPWHYAA